MHELLVSYAKRHFSLEQFRAFAETEVPLTGTNGLRKLIASRDIEYFARAYFADRVTLELPSIHRRMISRMESIRRKAIAGEPGTKTCMAIPRGHAKSTYLSLILPLHAALFGWSPLTVLIGNTQQASERLLKNIRDELTNNESILEDFGYTRGETWQASHIEANGCTIRAFGTGNGAIRGVATGASRPSLVIADDLDDDRLVRSPTELATATDWWDKAVMSLGDQVTFRTSYLVAGTIIRRTSLLQHIIDSPDFNSIVESGVIRFADNQDLWAEWRAWFLELARIGDAPQSPAEDTFYQEHREEMLRGTQVLWERPDAYWNLLRYKLSRGDAAFASEIQNKPGSGDGSLGQIRKVTWAEIGDTSGFLLYGSLDPTTKGGKKNDLAAYVECLFDPNRKILYVTYCDAKQRNYNKTVKDVSLRVKATETNPFASRYYDGFWCEDNVAIIADLLQQRVSANGSSLVVTKVHNSVSKAERIEVLAELSDLGQLFFVEGIDETMVRSYEEWPHSRYDDPIDALATIVRELRQSGALDMFPVGEDQDGFWTQG